ncbi:MAG: hypothetical protein JNM86_04215 [Phycisphaerae bacterium]|nr:hypothetical protein [Phycisphaerae bacterium]
MPKYQIRNAMILYSMDKLDGAMPVPPARECPLKFEMELGDEMAKIGRFRQLCDDLNASAPIDAFDLRDAREQLKARVATLLVLEGAQKVALDGGSQPTYRPIPPWHWTEDYFQFDDGAGNRTPWSIDVPLAKPTHRAYPCLRLAFEKLP